ncbi:heterogeneous nuclear ribonucleoprotein F-like [Watersipora subatra]|uniref:heterogeneous nuclear ribonucleoprotein F-like n=1 Tax=Watersipora subatra TaxID=2589382 RepID=UPI00355B2CCC
MGLIRHVARRLLTRTSASSSPTYSRCRLLTARNLLKDFQFEFSALSSVPSRIAPGPVGACTGRWYCTWVTEPLFIELKGVPYTATEQDIIDFLKGVSVVGGSEGVDLMLKRAAIRSGTAYVQVVSPDDVKTAEALNGVYLHDRYIQVRKVEEEKFKADITRTQLEPFKSLTGHTVQMSNLQRATTDQEIRKFFAPLEPIAVEVVKGSGFDWVNFKAFVDFSTHQEAKKAMAKQTTELGGNEISMTLISYPGNCTCYAKDGSQGIAKDTAYTDGHYIKLLGLPYRVTEQEIVNFLQGVSLEGGSRDVYIMLRKSGIKSGIGFVRLPAEQSLPVALNLHKQRIGERYVEVIQSTRHQFLSAIRATRLHPFMSVTGHSVELAEMPFDTKVEDIQSLFRPLRPLNIQFRFQKKTTVKVFLDFSSHDEASQAVETHDGEPTAMYLHSYPGKATCYPQLSSPR